MVRTNQIGGVYGAEFLCADWTCYFTDHVILPALPSHARPFRARPRLAPPRHEPSPALPSLRHALP